MIGTRLCASFFLCAFVVAIGRRRDEPAYPPVTAASRRANTQVRPYEIYDEIGAMGDAYAEVSMERKNLTSMGQAGIIAFVNR